MCNWFFSNFKSKLLPTSLNMDIQFHTNEVIIFNSLFINSNTGQNIVLVYRQKCKNFRFSWRLWVGLKKDCHDRKGLLWTIIVTAVDVSKAKGLKWLKQNIFSPTDQKQEYNLSLLYGFLCKIMRVIILCLSRHLKTETLYKKRTYLFRQKYVSAQRWKPQVLFIYLLYLFT